ncbi:hypothetical protein [Salegentibacter sp. Hel_I_6]|uniref:hypothetical protein n=1 Tax=Salegentibacter sp. Hel_I_6 TaxID=1250278 RepID=UPI0012DFFE61|nr:hypothetical protein [Salegentibacter sp. Hel_I_6]
MDLRAVKVLLERYDAGKTTLAQEEALRDYFNHNEVPQELMSYRLIFGYAEKSRRQKMEREVQLPGDKKNGKYLWTAIAASVVLLLGLFLFQNEPIAMQDSNLGTIQDKEEALQKSMETLRMVSELMNEGKEDLVYLKEFNNTKNKFFKN